MVNKMLLMLPIFASTSFSIITSVLILILFINMKGWWKGTVKLRTSQYFCFLVYAFSGSYSQSCLTYLGIIVLLSHMAVQVGFMALSSEMSIKHSG